MIGNGGAVFSLTPALSRWEREKRSQRLGKTKAGFSLGTCGFYETNQRLFLLPAGAKTSPAAAAELLASAGFRSALRHLRGTFDWILIDTPAVQALPDAGLFAAAADALLLTAALHKTPHKKIQSTLRRLHALNLPLKGTVLTHA